jgi:hypothetical protein
MGGARHGCLCYGLRVDSARRATRGLALKIKVNKHPKVLLILTEAAAMFYRQIT